MDRWPRVKQIFQSALDQEPEQRPAFVRDACGEDRDLRAEVESLLVAHEAAGRYDTSGSRAGDSLSADLIGREIGAYRVVSLLGAGGMGEVYRARDSKLHRDVAIKVLPAVFIADPDRLARLEREARLLATLNHPHIGAIYGLEDASRSPALVLELIEGETLAELLARTGRLGVDAALAMARQIADALEAAHEKGIVHRDLKPANIKITPDGSVKVLDFGLAKAATTTGSELGGTATGVLMGTAAYMSPEQARGQTVDRRTDIWSFGCVFYEMLTGRPAFAAETVSDTIASVMRGEPDWSALPRDLSSTLLVYLRRCLQRSPRDRVHDVADLRLALEGVFDVPAVVSEHRAAGTWKWRWLVAAVVLNAIGVGVIVWSPWSGTSVTPSFGAVRFAIDVGSMQRPFGMAVSPDGRFIAFAGRRSVGPEMLFVRPVGALDAQPLAGTEGAIHPFWSPDSRSLGFAVLSPTRQLKIVEVAGGRPRVVCDLLIGNPFGGTWNSDNVIVFGDNDSLYRVTAAAGTPTEVTRPDRSAGERRHLWPQFLPDGRHFLYLSQNSEPANNAIVIGSLDSTPAVRVVLSDTMATFVRPHFLLFARQQTLMAQQFDLSNLKLIGEPALIADGLMYRTSNGRAGFAASDAGTLLYRMGGPDTGQRVFVWFDRKGVIDSRISVPHNEHAIRLSPDGKRVAFVERRSRTTSNIWIYDLVRNQKTLLTQDPVFDHAPVWSPDGTRIGFESNRGGADLLMLYEKRLDGATAERPLVQPEPGTTYGLTDWTRDYIVFQKGKPGEPPDIWAQPLFGDRKAFSYLTQVGRTNAALSPNGRWLAYVINEAGTEQVVVQSFPDPTKMRQKVSTRSGAFPRWRPDGQELFYLDADWQLIAVPVLPDGTLAVDRSTELFTPPGFAFPPNALGYSYDMTPDGQRFLFSVEATNLETTAPITVVLNWQEALKRRVPQR